MNKSTSIIDQFIVSKSLLLSSYKKNVCGIVESVNIILDRRIAKYILNVINYYNITVTSLINTFLNCESSVFAENYRYIMYKYNIPSILWRSDFKTFISNILYTDDINDWQRINILVQQPNNKLDLKWDLEYIPCFLWILFPNTIYNKNPMDATLSSLSGF